MAGDGRVCIVEKDGHAIIAVAAYGNPTSGGDFAYYMEFNAKLHTKSSTLLWPHIKSCLMFVNLVHSFDLKYLELADHRCRLEAR